MNDKFHNPSRTYLTFDDVLLYPGESLPSREDASVTQNIPSIGVVKNPIIPANMDTIVGSYGMHEAVLSSGGIVVMHRYTSFAKRVRAVIEMSYSPRITCEAMRYQFVSIGVSEDEIGHAITETNENRRGVCRFCIDVAHGHSPKVISALLHLKSKAECVIIAGNIATPAGFLALAEAGADIVKVGVGPGSLCTTRIVTGAGVPQLSAVMDVAEARDEWEQQNGKYIPIIADGGIKNSGDIIKAIVAGADLVMSGSLFAGCPEASGEVVQGKAGGAFKRYTGMASKSAQEGWFGKEVVTPEGETTYVEFKPPVREVISSLVGGIKSGMSYVGCRNVEELRSRARFIRVTSHTLIENYPHGKN